MDFQQLFNEYYVYGGLILVGIMWGITNPLMEMGSKSQNLEQFDISLKFFLSIFTRIAFLLPFIVNQAASVLFNILLGRAPLTTAQAIANSCSSVVTLATESIIKKKPITLKTVLGIAFVTFGIYLCVTSQNEKSK
ncbi:hypothetical protein ABPG72_006635 [Tetrahymena utriculariae]